MAASAAGAADDDEVDLRGHDSPGAAGDDAGARGLAQLEARARLAEARARQLSERLRDNALRFGTFEHLLKSSFTIIAGWSRTLDEGWDRLTDEQRRAGVSTLRRKAEETVAAAQRLLDDVVSEVRDLDLRPVRLDLAEVLNQVVETHAASTHQHRFRYVGPRHLFVTVDPAALQQILGQLLENATKYSPAGTTISLAAGPADALGASVWFEVADEGDGIPDGVPLFQPFVRGGATANGSGLGLYIVDTLVDRLGGTITATRNTERGSTFTITLPDADANAAETPAPVILVDERLSS